MESQTTTNLLNLEEGIRRSTGRTGRTFSATAKVSRKEMNELQAVAVAQGKGFSEWCREVLLSAARGETVTPIFTEVLAIRMLLNRALRGDLKTTEAFDAEVQAIRKEKHKAAEQVMQQYTTGQAR